MAGWSNTDQPTLLFLLRIDRNWRREQGTHHAHDECTSIDHWMNSSKRAEFSCAGNGFSLPTLGWPDVSLRIRAIRVVGKRRLSRHFIRSLGWRARIELLRVGKRQDGALVAVACRARARVRPRPRVRRRPSRGGGLVRRAGARLQSARKPGGISLSGGRQRAASGEYSCFRATKMPTPRVADKSNIRITRVGEASRAKRGLKCRMAALPGSNIANVSCH